MEILEKLRKQNQNKLTTKTKMKQKINKKKNTHKAKRNSARSKTDMTLYMWRAGVLPTPQREHPKMWATGPPRPGQPPSTFGELRCSGLRLLLCRREWAQKLQNHLNSRSNLGAPCGDLCGPERPPLVVPRIVSAWSGNRNRTPLVTRTKFYTIYT